MKDVKSQSGFGHFFLLVIAALGVLGFLFTVSAGPFRDQMLAALFPKPASEASISNPISGPVNPSPTPQGRMNATFYLSPLPSAIQTGQQFTVDIGVNSNYEAANLLAAKFNFSPTKLEVVSVTTTAVVSNWVEKFFDNATGELSLIGGIPNPGLQTNWQSTVIAQVVFRAKASGEAFIQVDDEMAIYSNVDNTNILDTREDPSVIFMITSPVSSPTPSPTSSSSPTATPTATPAPVACAISSANWLVPFNPYQSNVSAGMLVQAAGDCANKQVSFEVFEDDGVLGSDTVKVNPSSVVLQPNNSNPGTYQAMGIWITEFQQDGFAGLNNPPEYYFLVTLAGGSTTKSATPMLQVTAEVGTPTPVRGDLTGDGVASLQDLSKLLTNWSRTENIDDQLDINEDGIINVFDFAELISILKEIGIIRPSAT